MPHQYATKTLNHYRKRGTCASRLGSCSGGGLAGRTFCCGWLVRERLAVRLAGCSFEPGRLAVAMAEKAAGQSLLCFRRLLPRL